MSDPFNTNGMFSWFEFVATDLSKTKSFYKEVVGWDFEFDQNNPNYTLNKNQGMPNPVKEMT